MLEATPFDVPRETIGKLTRLCELVIEANGTQNLIAPSTEATIWTRHVADSLQLLSLAPARGSWLDIGSGAGFPGMVIALASDARVTLVEPRSLRHQFLSSLIETFHLGDRVSVAPCKVERLQTGSFDIITARAVTSIEKLFAGSEQLSHPGTLWLLPKGRTARDELAEARRTWQGDFRLVPSLTDPDAAILVARGVKRRTKR